MSHSYQTQPQAECPSLGKPEEPNRPCTPADITILERLHPVHYMILDHLKFLAPPTTLCRVSRTFNEEMLPVIYDTITLDKNNINLFMEYQICWPVYEQRRRGITHTRAIEFVDQEAALNWEWITSRQNLSETCAKELERLKAKVPKLFEAEGKDGEIRRRHYGCKEMRWTNLQEVIYGNALVEAYIKVTYGQTYVKLYVERSEYRRMDQFPCDLLYPLHPQTIIINAPMIDLPKDDLFLTRLVGWNAMYRALPSLERIVVRLPDWLESPITGNNAKCVQEWLIALVDFSWATKAESSEDEWADSDPCAIAYAMEGPVGLAAFVGHWADEGRDLHLNWPEEMLEDLEIIEIE
ncbi:hypothetical protein I317_05171 [Kwoniella heveanensis CBS 569]|nr:hypothetical protein I317_05171 [Kwoniella heveanensis CBS 569]